MFCKRKIFGENLTRNKCAEDTCCRSDGSRMRESESEIHETRNYFHGNGRENGRQSRTDILQSNEHKRKFAKLKTYFTTLSVKISPSKIGSTIKNSRFLASKSCDNLLCNGSASSCHSNTQSEADGTAASSYKHTLPSWLIRSKPIGLKFGKFKVRYELCDFDKSLSHFRLIPLYLCFVQTCRLRLRQHQSLTLHNVTQMQRQPFSVLMFALLLTQC